MGWNRSIAKGTPDPNGQLGIAVRLDEQTFDEVQRAAIAANVSFVEQARIFVREGLARRKAERQAA